MYKQVPSYFTDGLQALGRGQRLANNAPIANYASTVGTVANKAFSAGLIMKDEAEKEEYLAKQRQFEESQLNVEKSLTTLVQQNEYDNSSFEQEASKQKADWLKEIPADQQPEYALMFDKYQSRFSSIIRGNEQKKVKQQQKATFLTAAQNYYDKAVNASRNDDQEDLTDTANRFMKIREDLMDGGFISAEAYVDMGQKFSDQIEAQKYLGEFDKIKPQGEVAVSQYVGGFMQREDIPVERRKKFANSMLADYQTYQAQNALLLHDLRESSAFIQNSVAAGLEPSIDTANVLSQLKAVGDLKEYNKLNKSIELGQSIKEFVKLTPEAMREELTTMQSQIDNQEQLTQYVALQKAFNSTITDLYADPIKFAVSRKIVQDNGFDLSNPESLKQRLNNGRLLQQKYKLSYTPLVSKNEAELLSTLVENNDSKTNAVLVGQLYKNFGDKSADIIKKIAPKNPQFTHAASLFGQDPASAVAILEGVNIAKSQTEYTPRSESDFDEAYYSRVDENLFSEMTTEWQGNLKNTIKTTVAKINYDHQKSDREVDTDYVKQAVKTVVGDIASIDMEDSGLLFDSSFKVPVPRGVNKDEFEDWYVGLDDNAFIGALTIDGKRPTAQEVHQFGILRYVGDGKYRVRLNGELLFDKNGQPLILNYPKAEE